MEMAVEYARERQQFGRQIGAYQGVSHRCADMLLNVEESRSLTYFAAWAADAEPESLPMAAAMANARASDAAWDTCANALQVFGGIGFTWEHDLQFWLKRSRVAGRMLGTPREHRERVADLVGLGAVAPLDALRLDRRAGDRPALAAELEVDVDRVVAAVATRTGRASSPASGRLLTCSL